MTDRALSDLAAYSLLDNPVRLWLVAAGALIVAVLVTALLRRILRKRFARAGETTTEFDDLVLEMAERTSLVLIFLIAAHLSLRMLELPPKLATAVRVVAVIAFFLQGGLWASGLVDFWLRRYRRRREESDAAAAMTLTLAGFVAKVALWSVLVLVALDNLGFNITALVAGLGIGGVAVALAVQNILGDLFASLSIVVDKPFVAGDFIVVGTEAGKVIDVGLKTTRVQSLSGEELIFSNSDLLTSRIRNFGRMKERRALFTFGVTYQTSRELLEKIPSMVREAIEKRELTRFDRAHFRSFGDSSLDFEAVYYVLTSEYNIYMDVQQAINLELVSAFAREGIEFAYPTRTILLSPPEGLTTRTRQ
jgi:small-conductance mechanosensitive channel